MYAEFPLDEALRILNRHGWNTFEVCTEHLAAIEGHSDPDAYVDRVREAATELECVMPQAHAFLQADVAARDSGEAERDIARLERHIKIAARFGVEVVVIHPGGKEVATTRSERDRIHTANRDAFRRLGDIAAKHHMTVALENLMSRYAAPYELIDLITEIDHPAVGVVFDTSHANVARLDLPKAIGEFGPYLAATHISDNDGSGDQHRTPGNGKIHWIPVMDAFREIGYQGTFNLEIPGERHADLALRGMQSRLALRVAEWLIQGRIDGGIDGKTDGSGWE